MSEGTVASPGESVAGFQGSELPPGVTPPANRESEPRFLSDVIVELGFVDAETVDSAVEAARAPGQTVARILLESGALNEDQLSRAIADRHCLDHVDLEQFEVDPEAAALISRSTALRYRALPIAFASDGAVILAMEDPVDALAINDTAAMTRSEVRTAVASGSAIEALIERLPYLDDNAGARRESATAAASAVPSPPAASDGGDPLDEQPAGAPSDGADPVSEQPAAAPSDGADPVSEQPAARPSDGGDPIGEQPAAAPSDAGDPVGEQPAAAAPPAPPAPAPVEDRAAEAALQDELATQRAARTAAEEELASERAVRTALEEELASEHAARAALEGESSKAQAALQTVSEELERARSNLAELGAQLERAEARSRELEQRVGELETADQRAEAARLALAELRDEFDREREQSTRLEGKLRNELTEAIARGDELERSLSSLVAAASDLHRASAEFAQRCEGPAGSDPTGNGR